MTLDLKQEFWTNQPHNKDDYPDDTWTFFAIRSPANVRVFEYDQDEEVLMVRIPTKAARMLALTLYHDLCEGDV